MELRFIPHEKSHYQIELQGMGDECAVCPIGMLDDIEIIFMHYKSEEEAREKWMRRKLRMNWDNLIFKMSEQNGCNEEILRLFDALPAKKKCLFVTKNYGLESQVIYRKYKGNNEVLNDTNDFRRYINLDDLISGHFNNLL